MSGLEKCSEQERLEREEFLIKVKLKDLLYIKKICDDEDVHYLVNRFISCKKRKGIGSIIILTILYLIMFFIGTSDQNISFLSNVLKSPFLIIYAFGILFLLLFNFVNSCLLSIEEAGYLNKALQKYPLSTEENVCITYTITPMSCKSGFPSFKWQKKKTYKPNQN